MPYPKIDDKKIRVKPLAARKSKTRIEDIAIDPDSPPADVPHIRGVVQETAQRIYKAKQSGSSVILAFGAHLIKNGLGPVLIKMMENQWVTHLATQGAGSIHDWELAFHGKTEEDVRANVASGTFGTWNETGRYINLAVLAGAPNGMGYGESLGALIENELLQLPDPDTLKSDLRQSLEQPSVLFAAKADLLSQMVHHNLKPGTVRIPHPYKKYSVFGNAFRFRVPITVHAGIGYDIVYDHPLASGAALGRGSHIDFQIFAHSVSGLTDGVYISIGSAIMAPQVFEKSLSYVNNILLQKGEKISGHYMVINDLQECQWDWAKGEPPKSSPDYYLRFLKSFSRMGGEMKYIAVDNRVFLPYLYHELKSVFGE